MPPDDDPERRDGALAAPASVDDLTVLRQAVRERRKARLGYRRATDADATERVVAPYALVVARGAWYAVAFCERSAGVRVFRLDRVTGVSLLDEAYAVPDSFSLDDLVRDGRVFRAAESRTLTVRYSARVAGWIAERERGVRGEDGSYTVIRGRPGIAMSPSDTGTSAITPA